MSHSNQLHCNIFKIAPVPNSFGIDRKTSQKGGENNAANKTFFIYTPKLLVYG